MVPGGFDNDRWDYDYYLKLRQFKHPRRARAAVYFKKDTVDHVDSDVMPVASEFANDAPGDAPVSPPADAPTGPSVTAPVAAPANDAPGTLPNSPLVVPASPETVAPPITATSPPSS
jgi:hypothetical protein